MDNDKPAATRMAEEVGALLKARNPVLWITTQEEGRVERANIETAVKFGFDVRTWDVITGVTDIEGRPTAEPPGATYTDPVQALNWIRNNPKEKCVWIMRDLHQWLRDPTTLRALRTAARVLPTQSVARSIIVLAPTADVPPELADHVTVVKWSLPDRAEMTRILDEAVASIPKAEDRASAVPDDNVRDAAIDAALGLSAETAQSCYAKSLVTMKFKIVPSIIAEEKKRVISGKGLEWSDPDPLGLDAVGGLDELKPWLSQRKLALTARARAFGLPPPKGIFLVGVPGCGKSLVAKATAACFGVPLVKLDLGAAQSKYVGESQQNIRAAFAIIDTIGRCVLWIDEIEKALAGATQGAADGGVSADALGTFLTWMQERKSSVFVIATSNDVSKLPPELLRKGRFDEMFFVDLPNATERREITRVTLKKFKRHEAPVDVDAVVAATDGFTGSEIDALLPDALFTAFADNERQITTEDLVGAAKRTVPLSRTASDKIEGLRKWADGKARPASKKEVVTAGGYGRKLDI